MAAFLSGDESKREKRAMKFITECVSRLRGWAACSNATASRSRAWGALARYKARALRKRNAFGNVGMAERGGFEPPTPFWGVTD
jgi:hypothetical protein